MDIKFTLEDIEEIVEYNLSYGISILKTLNSLGRADLIDYFSN